MTNDLEEYDLMYISQTEKGLCVRQDEDHQLFWLPKSQVKFEDKEYRRHATVKVKIPEWLAIQHGLV